MALSLVTVARVNVALRLDLDANVTGDDSADADLAGLDDIEARIEEATDIVIDYLKMKPEDVEWTAETAPPRVQAAIILVIDCLLDDTPEKMQMLAGLHGAQLDLSNPIVALLYRLRDPAMA